ncbi:OmpH family outer membrane protein [Vreelandella jeotgali]|uniref:OmpH family outer membrane protein n=1 Tax=Vreelandella jeotgali TaxID=553386 RepID=UPI000348072C|nr:OmpH family outer membrane protein [Halomonas jeotgali]
MRKWVVAAVFAVASAASAAPVLAADVAVLDWRAALMNTESAQSSLSDLEGQVGDRQSKAKRLGNELQDLQKRLRNEGDVMSDAERQRLTSRLQEKGQRFESLRKEVLSARQRSEKQFLDQAEPKLERAVDRVIERHGIDIVVEPRGVLHSSMDLPNLTDEVTQEFNALN